MEKFHKSGEHFFVVVLRYVVTVTADRQRNRPKRTQSWTTKVPPTRRRGPEDIMHKPEQLSPEAQEAKTAADIWGLFFSDTMMSKMVKYTNDKIQETLDKKQLTLEQIRKAPHLKPVDMVSTVLYHVPGCSSLDLTFSSPK